MATETLLLPASNRITPGSKLTPIASFPSSKESNFSSSPDTIASEWVKAFNAFVQHDNDDIKQVFLPEACWRDLLCSTWDFHTLSGRDKITQFVTNTPKDSRIQSISLDPSASYKTPQSTQLGGVNVIQAFLAIDTPVGRGKGVVRLAVDPDDGDRWKVFTLATILHEVKGHEETTRSRRPTGLNRKVEAGGRNWRDELVSQHSLEGDKEPVVLIIGAGQGGLSVAARLKQLGVGALVIDQNPRLGDNWRNRYHQLVLHDAVWYDHMPYLNFPPNWPIFTPKDKLADWFEYYAGILELNVWTSTTIKSSSWSQADRKWTIGLTSEKDGKSESRTLHPHHVILATGHSGEPDFPSNITGLSNFQGSRLLHSSQFTQPPPSTNDKGEPKHAIVVGSCNSGHDIARDYHDHGWKVTMIQRSSTCVVRSETLLTTLKGVYDEDGPPVEDADILAQSLPSPIAKRLDISTYNSDTPTSLFAQDMPLLNGLREAGFAVDSGPDGAGLVQKYLHRGGGYYIDVGCSELIASGKIGVRSGVEVKEVKAHSVVLRKTNGGKEEEGKEEEELPATEVVFATGYKNMLTTAHNIFGAEALGASEEEGRGAVGEVWGFDDEGEMRGMWRGTGHPGFWFMGGNLALCRFYSRLLALQVLGAELGMKK